MSPTMTAFERVEKLAKQLNAALKDLKAEITLPTMRDLDVDNSIHTIYENRSPVEVEHERKITSRRITKAVEMSQNKGMRLTPAHVSK